MTEQVRSPKSDKPRAYQMKQRALSVDETRQRIVEATVRLHGSLGPAQTSIAAIAQEASVTRLTVYRHFPDLDALFGACTAHWAAQQQLPDLDAWLAIADPEARLRFALTDVYRFFGDAQQMLELVNRDREAMPTFVRERSQARDEARVESVLSAWPARRRTARRRALIGHALAFTTWHSLCVEQGLRRTRAADEMVRLVIGA